MGCTLSPQLPSVVRSCAGLGYTTCLMTSFVRVMCMILLPPVWRSWERVGMVLLLCPSYVMTPFLWFESYAWLCYHLGDDVIHWLVRVSFSNVVTTYAVTSCLVLSNVICVVTSLWVVWVTFLTWLSLCDDVTWEVVRIIYVWVC